MKTISREALEDRLAHELPDNRDRNHGYALVDVLDHASFTEEHIPHSLNIPKGSELEFGRRFDHSKEIIIYCDSATCPASIAVAETLERQGFNNVYRYEGGMKEWKKEGNVYGRGDDTVQTMNIR